MATNKEIIEDTFPIAHYDSNKEREYVKNSINKAINKARADERKRLGKGDDMKQMWIVMTGEGIAHIGRNTKGSEKGHFWNWVSKSLGYPPIFKKKEDALKFAKKIRKQRTAIKPIEIVAVEFYKNELE